MQEEAAPIASAAEKEEMAANEEEETATITTAPRLSLVLDDQDEDTMEVLHMLDLVQTANDDSDDDILAKAKEKGIRKSTGTMDVAIGAENEKINGKLSEHDLVQNAKDDDDATAKGKSDPGMISTGTIYDVANKKGKADDGTINVAMGAVPSKKGKAGDNEIESEDMLESEDILEVVRERALLDRMTDDSARATETPPLARSTNHSVPMRPGAYSFTPGESTSQELLPATSRTRLQSTLSTSMSFATDSVGEFTTSHRSDDAEDSSISGDLQQAEEGLAVAEMIDASHRSANDREVATPATDAATLTKRRLWQRRGWMGKLAILCLLIVVIPVVVVVVVLTVDRNNGDSEEIAPTTTPTFAPTASLTPAPTPFFVELPDYTIDAITTPDSPQAQAYRWLSLDPWLQNYTDTRLLQRMALASLYYATNGDTSWTQDNSWLDYEVHECNWLSRLIPVPYPNVIFQHDEDTNVYQVVGIPEACNEDGNYVALVLNKNELAGSLPPEISFLTDLLVLDVANNAITGSVPSQIGLLTNLMEVVADENELTGALPSEIGLLQNMGILFLHYNSISGTIPPEVWKLSNLEDLVIYSNGFTGTLPLEMALLSNSLTAFSSWGNRFSGTIPADWGQLSKLTNLDVSYNRRINGTIPREISQLSILETLYLSANALTGTVPTELGLLTNLEHFWLDENVLTGTVPSELSMLTMLEILYLGINQLSGSMPSELAKLPMLERLWLGPSDLTGTIPSEFGLLETLHYLGIWETQVTGMIPTELAKLSALTVLSIEGNALTGPVPSELGLLPVLRDLYLDHNDFTGTIPIELNASSASLEWLSVNESSLTGYIPSGLCDVVDVNPMQLNCSSVFCGCGCACVGEQEASDSELAGNTTATAAPSESQ